MSIEASKRMCVTVRQLPRDLHPHVEPGRQVGDADPANRQFVVEER